MNHPAPLRLTECPLANLRRKPVADEVQKAAARKGDYRAHPIDAGHPLHSAPMVALSEYGIAGANHYHAHHNPPYHCDVTDAVPDLLVRAPVADRLARVNAALAPYALELWVFDAWRPIAVQNYFHDQWMPDYLRQARPDLQGAALAAEVTQYWAKGAPGGVIDPSSPPPHATGGAVDLTIRDKVSGAHLFMGSIFDDVTALSNTGHFEDARDAMSFSALEARDNRRMLYWLMAAEGLANNPTEWWHFSWGDQMWARIVGAEAAVFGPASVEL